jgi:hypothetical protein
MSNSTTQNKVLAQQTTTPSHRPSRIPARRPDVTHVLTGFRFVSAVDALRSAPSKIAAANAELAYREHCKAIGVTP